MEIDEAEVGTELSAIQMQIQNEYDELVQEISDLFAQQEHEKIKILVDKTSYYERMLNEIDARQEKAKYS